jgi:hypothetical protein
MVFTGCNNDSVQGVELESVSAPKNVTAAWVAEVKDIVATTDVNEAKGAHLLVTWNAVVDADGYDIVYSQEGAKNYKYLSSGWDGIGKSTTTVSTTADTDGKYTYTVTHTLDLDKAEAEVDEYNNGLQLIKDYGGLTLRIGVVSKSKNESHKNPSKPAWAKDLVNIPNTYKQSY